MRRELDQKRWRDILPPPKFPVKLRRPIDIRNRDDDGLDLHIDLRDACVSRVINAHFILQICIVSLPYFSVQLFTDPSSNSRMVCLGFMVNNG